MTLTDRQRRAMFANQRKTEAFNKKRMTGEIGFRKPTPEELTKNNLRTRNMPGKDEFLTIIPSAKHFERPKNEEQMEFTGKLDRQQEQFITFMAGEAETNPNPKVRKELQGDFKRLGIRIKEPPKVSNESKLEKRRFPVIDERTSGHPRLK